MEHTDYREITSGFCIVTEGKIRIGRKKATTRCGRIAD
jgi:hypothetical protein